MPAKNYGENLLLRSTSVYENIMFTMEETDGVLPFMDVRFTRLGENGEEEPGMAKPTNTNSGQVQFQ